MDKDFDGKIYGPGPKTSLTVESSPVNIQNSFKAMNWNFSLPSECTICFDTLYVEKQGVKMLMEDYIAGIVDAHLSNLTKGAIKNEN